MKKLFFKTLPNKPILQQKGYIGSICSLIQLFALILFASSSVADPVTFSFASDDEENGPTFYGFPGNGIIGKAQLTLFVDTNGDLPGGQHQFESVFGLKAKTFDYVVVPYGSQWMHMWRLGGKYEFRQIGIAGSPTIFSARFNSAVLTSISTSVTSAGETFTIQDFERIDPNMVMAPQAPLFAIGVGPNALRFQEDMTFTLSNAKSAGSSVDLTPSGSFINNWQAEGSYSATGSKIP